MKLDPERRRLLGALAVLVGLGLALGGVVYGQLRFPMTNYRSSLTVDRPLVYYSHELRAGDSLFFHIEVTGDPVWMEIRRGSMDSGDTILVTMLDRWGIVPLSVPASGLYFVLFRASCSTCSALIRAQVDQALGSIGILPLPATVFLGAVLAGAGTWTVAVQGRRTDL
jgi:hypothetical protein